MEWVLINLIGTSFLAVSGLLDFYTWRRETENHELPLDREDFGDNIDPRELPAVGSGREDDSLSEAYRLDIVIPLGYGIGFLLQFVGLAVYLGVI